MYKKYFVDGDNKVHLAVCSYLTLTLLATETIPIHVPLIEGANP